MAAYRLTKGAITRPWKVDALLLLVGGGFASALMGIVLGIAGTRIEAVSRRPPGSIARAVAGVWPWALGTGVLGYLGLFPGLVLLSQLLAADDPNLVLGLAALSFAALLLALVGARAHDRVEAR